MMGNQQYDIAIIGGGLAGLCLSIQTAEAGYKVVLFEKERYPFHKVCGEYISFESKNFLERLGVPLSDWNLPSIKKLQVSDIAGQNYFFDLPLGGFGVSRFTLDNSLYNIAKNKGVTIFTNCKIDDITFKKEHFSVSCSSGVIDAAVVAATHGKRSNLDIKYNRNFIQAKSNKLNNYIGIKYHVRYSHPKDVIALHNFKNGYCGISNIEEDKCCLCYLTKAENLKSNNNSVKQMELEVLGQNKNLRKIFKEAEFLYKQPLAISQISFNKKTQVEEHALMVGDSAGMITPLCGNGMSMAMHGSKIAFENIDNFLQGNIDRLQMEKAYIKQWQQQFSKRLLIGRTVQRFFGGHTATGLFFKAMHSIPSLAKLVIKSTHGDVF